MYRKMLNQSNFICRALHLYSLKWFTGDWQEFKETQIKMVKVNQKHLIKKTRVNHYPWIFFFRYVTFFHCSSFKTNIFPVSFDHFVLILSYFFLKHQNRDMYVLKLCAGMLFWHSHFCPPGGRNVGLTHSWYTIKYPLAYSAGNIIMSSPSLK